MNERVERLAPGRRSVIARRIAVELRSAHASPAPAARGRGAVEHDAPVELGQALVGHGTSEGSHSRGSVREALSCPSLDPYVTRLTQAAMS